MPEKMIFGLLTNFVFFSGRLDTMQNYHWGILAKDYLKQYPDRDLEIFRCIMSRLGDENYLSLKTHNCFHEIAEITAKTKPVETWKIVTNLLDDLDSRLAYLVLHWLGEDLSFDEDTKIRPITYFKSDDVFAWIEVNPEKRACFIASAAPRTLDASNGGEITLEILRRYGHIENVAGAIAASFFTGGWSGPASQQYRKKRDQARSWLDGEKSSNVINWVEKHIEQLNGYIKREEIQEERKY